MTFKPFTHYFSFQGIGSINHKWFTGGHELKMLQIYFRKFLQNKQLWKICGKANNKAAKLYYILVNHHIYDHRDYCIIVPV